MLFLIAVFAICNCCADRLSSRSLHHSLSLPTNSNREMIHQSSQRCLNFMPPPSASLLARHGVGKFGFIYHKPFHSSIVITDKGFRLGYSFHQKRPRRGLPHQMESDSSSGRDPNVAQDICSVPDGLDQAIPVTPRMSCTPPINTQCAGAGAGAVPCRHHGCSAQR
jgi:hypothetical protein